MKKLWGIVISVGITSIFVGCSSDADMASYNVSKAADMFEIDRRVVFYNGITGDYILSIEGRCSIKKDRADDQLEVTCKTGANTFKKHFLGISNNVTYFAEQLQPKSVSTYHYRVVFRPEVIVPDISVVSSLTGIPKE